ncbi:MAG TPA: ACP S-malonyltransferase [Opitutaceae bacterium]|nr:ACP S-malonyltransferase [Opitutaceae bacterium]
MAIALLFSGQGAQKVGIGRTLHDAFPSARALYARANEILGWDLAKICFEGPEETLTETKVCQPALFVHGFAVQAILKAQGRLAELKFALGLSLGEVTALATAGVFDFETGLRVVAERGRLMQEACEATKGGMASVIGEEREKVAELCAEFGIEIANLNSPGQIVISGEKSRVEAAVAISKERGFRRVIPLNVAGAYHSGLMEPARVKFESFLAGVEFRPPQLIVLTNTTGKAVSDPAAIREALVKQVVSPVLWEDCMREAARLGATKFIECGPGAVLAGLARRTERDWSVTSISEAADLAQA